MFEGTKLLDYGICACGHGAEAIPAIAAKRIDNLIRLLHPVSIVIRQQSQPYHRFRPASQSLFQSVRRIAQNHSIGIRQMTYADIQAAFAPFHVQTKYDVASVAAHFFPELLAKLPAARKAWQPEQEVIILFDAVAVGIIDIEKRRGQLLPFL